MINFEDDVNLQVEAARAYVRHMGDLLVDLRYQFKQDIIANPSKEEVGIVLQRAREINTLADRVKACDMFVLHVTGGSDATSD